MKDSITIKEKKTKQRNSIPSAGANEIIRIKQLYVDRSIAPTKTITRIFSVNNWSSYPVPVL